MEWYIVEPGPADAALLTTGTDDLFDDPVSLAGATAFLAAPGHLIVLAVAAGRAVGFASGAIVLHPDKPATLFVNEVGVEEGHRRRGIGRALVAALIARGTDRGCASAWVATEGCNAAARGLYRALGGQETPDVVMFEWDQPDEG